MAAVYPPPNQIISVLAIEASWQEESVVATVGVEPVLLGRAGRAPGMGALVPVVDIVCGSLVSRHAEGDWLATSDAWLHERSPAEGSIEASARLLRVSRRSAVAACEVTAGGTAIATGTVEFSRIRNPETSRTVRPGRDGLPTRIGSGPVLDRPLDEACGVEIVGSDRGEVSMARSAFVNNSTGTFQGGAIALLADASAAAIIGPGARVIDLQYRFLARTGDGPAVATAEIVRDDGRSSTVRVEVVDRSTATLVGLAMATVLHP